VKLFLYIFNDLWGCYSKASLGYVYSRLWLDEGLV